MPQGQPSLPGTLNRRRAALVAWASRHPLRSIALAAVLSTALSLAVGYSTPDARWPWLVVGVAAALGLGLALPAHDHARRGLSALSTLVLTAILWSIVVTLLALFCSCMG